MLGTPSREDIAAMNPNYTDFKFPQIKAHPWARVFSKRLPVDAIDLVWKLASNRVLCSWLKANGSMSARGVGGPGQGNIGVCVLARNGKWERGGRRQACSQ